MRLSSFILIMTITHTIPAGAARPDIDDIGAFTDFVYGKWQKLARKAKLTEWSPRRYEQYDTYILKLINKMKKGEENCNRVVDKLLVQPVDDDARSRRFVKDAIKYAKKDSKKGNDDSRPTLLELDITAFRRTLMQEFHKKVSEADAKRSKKGARSSLTHWMTHIMRKFRQIIDYHILECTVSPLEHENLSSRYNNLIARRAKLHSMGENLIKKSKSYWERQDKQAGRNKE